MLDFLRRRRGARARWPSRAELEATAAYQEAREAYQRWAREPGRLTREERAAKAQAEARMDRARVSYHAARTPQRGAPTRGLAAKGPSVPGVRVYDQGSYYRVTASEAFVYDWSRRWPGSQFRHLNRGVSFTFDKRNGDLVDLFPYELDGDDVLALSEDLQRIGARRLGLEPGGSRAGMWAGVGRGRRAGTSLSSAERAELIKQLWRGKHPDYRSSRGDETHPSITAFGPLGTTLIPLNRASDEELISLRDTGYLPGVQRPKSPW